jgi:uncharacterized Rmd1/YagE family protein
MSYSGHGTFDEYLQLVDVEVEELQIFPPIDHTQESQREGLLPTKSETRAVSERPEGPAQTRRRMRRGHKDEPGVGSVFVLSLGETIDIEKILEEWSTDAGLLEVASSIEQFGGAESEVLLLKMKPEGLDCFVMEIGVIVSWGSSRPELAHVAGKLKRYIVNSQEAITNNMFEDDFVYIPASLRANTDAPLLSYIRGDVVYLSTDSAYERLSYSYAFAQSVKLDVYEDAVSRAIEAVKDIPEVIVKTGKVGMTSKELNRKIGELYIHRSNLNLHSDILDTPNCLWDLDTVSAVYRLCRKYQDIEKRLAILNHRLDVMKDMYEMVRTELSIDDYSRLEMIVVWLIVLEVMIELIIIVVPLWII